MLLRFTRRLLSTSSSTSPSTSPSTSHPATTPNQPAVPWPHLKKRSRPPGETAPSDARPLIRSLNARRHEGPAAATSSPSDAAAAAAGGGGGGGGEAASPPPPEAGQEENPPRRDPRLMLIIQGLSPSLNPSDFYRLSPSDLSSWQNAIQKVQQQRSSGTLHPLGRYHLTFSSAPAAVSYRDRLLRLHKLSLNRLAHPHALWESLLPVHLRSPAGDDPRTELGTFTITSGVQAARGAGPVLDIQRRRVAVTHPWERRLRDLTGRFAAEHGERPPVVLLRVYPPGVTAAQLEGWIREDGLSRGCPWEVCPPQELLLSRKSAAAEGGSSPQAAPGRAPGGTLPSRDDPADKTDAQEGTPQGRFVVVCANDVEARRFHRHWNQRAVTDKNATRPTRNMVHASIIDW